MKGEINDVIQSAGGYEGIERLAKHGRQLHNRAVCDLFAGFASNLFHLLKTGAGSFAGGRRAARGLGVQDDAQQHAV